MNNNYKMETSLSYNRDTLTKKELKDISNRLRKHNIDFLVHDISNKPQNSVHEIVAPIVFALSSEIGQLLMLNMVTALIYDLIKSTTLLILRRISNKPVTFLSSGGKTKLQSATMDLLISLSAHQSIRFKFKGNLSRKQQEYYLNKAFKLIGKLDLSKISTEHIASIDNRKEDWIQSSSVVFIKSLIKKQKERRRSKNNKLLW